MRAMTILCAVLALTVACKKKGEEQKPAPEPKMVDKSKVETPPPAPKNADVPVTSKSPEAVKEFETGRDLADNVRGAEAMEHFKKAIELDPDFAQAHMYVGGLTPGSAGAQELDKAVSLADKLPEAEKQLILASQAFRNGDQAKGKAGLEKVLELAPGAWRIDVILANDARDGNDLDGSIKHLEHALSVKPDLAQAQNGLAYAYAGKKDWDKAIAAGKKQVELLPKEPNPHDTLAEILLWSGKFDEAEKEFAAAAAADPKFAIAWQGVGLSRAFRGDFKGTYEAFDKRAASGDPNEKSAAMTETAWILFAENKLPQALAKLDELDKDSAVKTTPTYADVALNRGHILIQAGKYADGLKALDEATKRAESLPGAGKRGIANGVRLGMLRAAAFSGKPAANADKLLADADENAKQNGNPPSAASMLAYQRGLVAWAKKDVKGAIAEMSKCGDDVLVCRFDLATAQRKSGDKAGAEATEKAFKETPRRDPPQIYMWTHLGKA